MVNNEIWKFSFVFGKTRQTFSMPKASRIISAIIQNNNICLYAFVDKNKEFEERTFEYFGTGIHIPYDFNRITFIQTVSMYDANLVFHVFEVTR